MPSEPGSRDSTPEAPLPDRIGRYVVKALVGDGAMGRVYRVYDPSLDRAAAIKVVRVASGLPPDVLASYALRFQNEARAAARLKHPNIVAVYDLGQMTDGTPYLVFEFVEGESLRAMLRRVGRLEPQRVLYVVDAIAAALDHAHRIGIVHRDVKPDNILLGRDHAVKLADFGVARLPDAELTKEGQFLGTPGYAAPESLMRGDYSPLADVFGLAVVAYEVLVGERPFRGLDAMSVAQQVIHAQAPSLRGQVEDAPPLADEILRRALAKDPADRFPSAGSFARALRSAYERSLLEATGRRRPLPEPPSGRGTLVALALGGLVLLALIAVVVSAVVSGGGPSAGDAGDAGADAAMLDTSGAVLLPPPPDAGAPGGPTKLRPIEEEERIKDLLDDARDAQRRGDRAGALRAVDEVLRLDPRHPEARQLRESLR